VKYVLRVDCISSVDGHGSEVETVVEEAKNARRSYTSESRHHHNDNETEFWGYLDVRPGAHMFYWLYHSYHPDGYLQRPLIIWLQVRYEGIRSVERIPPYRPTTGGI